MSSSNPRETPNYFLNHEPTELERLEVQHQGFLQIMHGKAIHASLSEPKSILDIGCGTGAMTIILAKQYPAAQVIGIDLAPPPTMHEKPGNVTYLQGDVRELINNGSLKPGEFDFVFSRMLVMGMRDWPGYVKDVASLLAPGGWTEMQELNCEVYDKTGNLISAEWPAMIALLEIFNERGMDAICGYHLKANMEAAGLANVKSEDFPYPRAPWPERPETSIMASLVQNKNYNIQAANTIVDKMFGASGKYSPEKLEELRASAKSTVFDGKEGDHSKFSVCYGQRPV